MRYVAFIGILLILAGCYKEKDYDPSKRNIDSVLKVRVSRASIPADSVSLDTIYLYIDKEMDSTRTTVKARTSAGTIVESGNASYTVRLPLNTDTLQFFSYFTLKSSGKVDSAIIRLDFETITKYVTVYFTRAYPNAIQINAASFSIKPQNTATGEVNFSCLLKRDLGIPTQKSEVQIHVFDSFFRPMDTVGTFRQYSNLSDNTGNTQFIYTLGDSVLNGFNYTGKLYLIASTVAGVADTISDTLTLISSK